MNDNPTSAILPNLAVWLVAGILIGAVLYMILWPSVPITPATPTVPTTPPTNTTPAAPSLPSNVSFTLLTDSTCKDCNSTAGLLQQLVGSAGQFSLTVEGTKTVAASSAEGKALISKYNIGWLPTLIVSWEANSSTEFVSSWVPSWGTRESDGSFVYRNIYPPYHDLENDSYVGYVSFIGIDVDNCNGCANSTAYMMSFANPQFAVAITNSTILKHNSTEAQALIAKYNLTKLPTFLLSPGAMAYQPIANYWSQVEKPESDGWIAYRNVLPPYYDVENKTLVGMLSLVELVDPDCSTCYDVGIHYTGLMSSFQVVFQNRTTYNITSMEGKALVQKYGITEVPTILISPGASLYPTLVNAWNASGNTIESDGWFVFRTVAQFEGMTYRNLTSNTTETS